VSGQDRAAEGAAAAEGAVDGGLLAAALAVHAHLEAREQLRVLLRYAVEWLEADCGFALAPGDARSTWSPIAATVPKDDERRAALGSFEPSGLRGFVENGERVFAGLGPFGEAAGPWPGAAPDFSLAFPVEDPEGRWSAVLALFAGERPAATRIARLSRLLEQVRPAVANARRMQSLRELVIKDDTAHCFNRRYFETSLPEELARASRFRSALSLIFLDMDNLKEVNQRHGHSMGSLTLREVSRRIRSKVRRFDKLFRFGGDEFCIVLPETEWHGALEVAERVRDAIASKPFLVGEVEDPAGVRMTASLGIAAFPLHARTQQELIEHADRAMQRVKRGTKNSIGIAEIVGGQHGG
jgi:diguanylate cyclase (GGDEF)-like protein